MKKYKRVIVLVFLFAGLFITPIVVFASSDQFKQKAQEWYSRNCKPSASREQSMMCYIYDKVHELESVVNGILTRLDTNDANDKEQSLKITELESKLNKLLASPSPSPSPLEIWVYN
ncbi:hypothetical protein HY408_00430 [Candidatus Gottesmanbacteria bacterium]|nr:hypothetical protein [Candidatus Gottesmanbacteria bacterium]